jgi:CheY-like chemotaxis protein
MRSRDLGAARLRVLIIDDEPAVVRLLTIVLGQDYDVIGLTDARAALRRLVEGDAFDVVLTDVNMPELSGIELAMRMREHRPELGARIVFMTGGIFDTEVRRALSGGPNPLLEKPFDIRTFDDAVGRIVGPKRPPMPGLASTSPSVPPPDAYGRVAAKGHG